VLKKASARRECKQYQRQWKGFCVDRHLDDAWLERLNALETLELISICEGHHDRRGEFPSTRAHMKLRLKRRYFPSVARQWEGEKARVLDRVTELFRVGETNINMEMKHRLRWGRGRLTYQEELVMRLHASVERVGEELDESTRAWFEHSLDHVEGLDKLMLGIWQRSGDAVP
jgi:hypothetical protein